MAQTRKFEGFGEVNFGKRGIVVKKVDPVKERITFLFVHGTKVEVELQDFSKDVRHQAMLFGFGTKLGNFYAAADGSSEDAERTLKAGIEGLMTGWSVRGEKGDTDLELAMSEWAGIEVEEAREQLKTLSKKELAALPGIPEIGAILQRIKNAKAKEAGQDLDREALLKKFKKA